MVTFVCSIFDKKDAFDFDIVNFPDLSGNIPTAPAYDTYRVATRLENPGNPGNIMGFYFVLEMSWKMTHFYGKVLERSLNFQIRDSKFINLKICFPCK